MKIKISFLLLFIVNFGFSQLSDSTEISIITSGPGNHLYEKFGHSAIRINDRKHNFDELYNYGIFDFNDGDFYWNFTKGFMNYKLVRYPFYLALRNANKETRWVKEQVLNLTLEEKNEVYTFLETNLLPENAGYLYDPFFDNCATRPSNIIIQTLGNKFNFIDTFSSNKSLRDLMNDRINQNTWGGLGINIALGSKLDRIINPIEYLYLPDYLFEMLKTSTIKNNDGTQKNILKKTNILLNFKPKKATSDLISPLLMFLLLLTLVLFTTNKNYKSKRRIKILDFSLFFITGLAGCVFVFLSFFTNHSTAPNNFNILWGFAPNLLVAFLLLRNNLPKWISFYFLFLIFLLTCIPVIWITRVQVFNWTLIPFLIALSIRYLYLYQHTKQPNISH